MTSKIIFVISELSGNSIIHCEGNAELINGYSSHLGDWMLEEETPKEEGVYTALMTVNSFQSNHPLDPVEWDMTITFDKVERVVPFKNEFPIDELD